MKANDQSKGKTTLDHCLNFDAAEVLAKADRYGKLLSLLLKYYPYSKYVYSIIPIRNTYKYIVSFFTVCLKYFLYSLYNL